MKQIQMVDLRGQYERLKPEIFGAIEQVLESTAYINGPEVKRLQEGLEEYLGVNHVVPCANGTDALQIALMALDIKPGDEVITTDFTFAATVEVIALLQLTPVLVDVDERSFNINVDAVRAVITPKTKAIVPVHLFGQSAPMEEIMKIAREHKLYVIEDNAQAIGANYHFSDGRTHKTGTIGHIGTTSFFPSKNLGCYGDGGAIFTNDDKFAHKLRGIVNHGMYVRYHHDEVGVNSRLDSIQAAVLNAKLRHLDRYNSARREAATKYNARFKDHPKILIPFEAGQPDSHVYHQYTLRILDSDRDALVSFLHENGIPCGVYYPIPLHSQKAYAHSRFRESDFPVTERLVKEVISLPMHTELMDEQIDFIARKVLEFVPKT